LSDDWVAPAECRRSEISSVPELALAGIARYQAITSCGDMRGLESAEKAKEKTSQTLKRTL
jgi:hypothetical protein